MDSMDCKPAYEDLDWRAYLWTIQKGLHSAMASRTAAILESVPCWWGIGQISAGLRHHWWPKFRFDWFDDGAQFSNGSYGPWAKVTRPSASEVRSNPTFSLDTCSCSWIEKSPENGAMGLFSGRSQSAGHGTPASLRICRDRCPGRRGGLRLSTRLHSLWNRSSELLLGGKIEFTDFSDKSGGKGWASSYMVYRMRCVSCILHLTTPFSFWVLFVDFQEPFHPFSQVCQESDFNG